MDKFIDWYKAEVGVVGNIILIGVAAVLVILWIVAVILKHKDKNKLKNTDTWVKKKREMQVIKGVAQRQKKDDGSEPQELQPVFIDTEGKPQVINGYYQKSNTAPIRPAYSNTRSARRIQMQELESERVGAEALTSALVMDSAAPSAVKATGPVNQRVKPTELKRPTASKTSAFDVKAKAEHDEMIKQKKESEKQNQMYKDGIRPTIGSEVANAVTERPAEVQDEKPDILKSGEEAIIPAAAKPVPGFAAAKKEPIKRPKSASVTRNVKEETDSAEGE
ncbi:MAG: hypothetical protein K5745_00310 [Saccharofermentans sp.]|nr:hypothetical protein [Saccharofermentans sp.]